MRRGFCQNWNHILAERRTSVILLGDEQRKRSWRTWIVPLARYPRPENEPKKTELGYATFFCLTCRRSFNERTGTPFNYLEFPTDIVLLVVFWVVTLNRGAKECQTVWSLFWRRFIDHCLLSMKRLQERITSIQSHYPKIFARTLNEGLPTPSVSMASGSARQIGCVAKKFKLIKMIYRIAASETLLVKRCASFTCFTWMRLSSIHYFDEFNFFLQRNP